MTPPDRPSEPIRWPPGGRADRDADLEQVLRKLCDHNALLAPALARDAIFWLDLGRPPEAVEQWLLGELVSNPGASIPTGERDAEPGGGAQPPTERHPVAPKRRRRRLRASRSRTMTIR